MLSENGIDWADSLIDTDSNTLRISNASQKQQIGVRYRGLTIPAGATILGAYANFQVVSQTGGSGLSITINGEDDASPASFGTYANFTGRSKTSESETWAGQAWSVGATVRSPDIKDVIQEIVDLGGWVSGNDIVLLFEPSGSGVIRFASFDHASYNEPSLTVAYFDGKAIGRASTCEDEVYVSNKDNVAQLSHIYRYDDSAATFSANLAGETSPFNLFPDPIALDDIIYFGSVTGPFTNLVFDIGNIADSGIGIAWQYWNGASWDTLAWTDDKDNYYKFLISGVGCLTWLHPTSWDTTTINGINAYWVRARVSTAAGNTPTQQNRAVYTVTKSSVDIDEDIVGGDITALSKIDIVSTSSAVVSAGGGLPLNGKFLVGLRSLSRGNNFVQHINTGGQNNDNISTTIDGAGTVYGSMNSSPTGSVIRNAWGGAEAETLQFHWTISTPLADEYYGKYRAFIRAAASVSDIEGGDIQSYLEVSLGSSTKTKIVNIINNGLSNYYFDYGIISLPPSILPEVYQGDIEISVYSINNYGAVNFYWVDLVLVPVDEYALEIRHEEDAMINRKGISTADSVSYVGKSSVFSVYRYESDYQIYDVPEVISSGPIQLQANADQRLYFFVPDVFGYEWLGRIQAWKNERYLTFRGDS